MGEDLEAVYEVRRQARGVAPPAKQQRWKRWLMIIGSSLFALAALIAGVLLWRAFTYVKTISGEVYVKTIGVPSKVDARVVKLHVHDAQPVEEGQLLAELEDSDFRASLMAAEAAVAVRQSQCSQAEANCELTKVRVEGAIATAHARVTSAEARVRNAQAALDLRRAQVAAEIIRAEAQAGESRATLARLKRGARDEDIKAAEERLDSAKALKELYDIEVTQSEELVAEGIDSQHVLQTKKTQLARQVNEVRMAELALERLKTGATEEEITAAEQVLAAREANVAIARVGEKEAETLETQLAIRRAEVGEAQAELALAKAGQSEVVAAEEQVKAAQAELQQANATLERNKIALAATRVVSPVTGRVLNVHPDEGEMARANAILADVIDDSRGIWISAHVREKDAWRVQKGQKARVEIRINSGNYCDAVVEEVGITTASVYTGGSAPAGQGLANPVWVKIRPTDIEHEVRAGYLARAWIKVR